MKFLSNLNYNKFHPFFVSIFLFILSFSIYLIAMCPTVYWGDCGEFIVAANKLGIAHSPGHPLYTLIGRLFSMLPAGNPAFPLNLMSVFFSALTVALLVQTLQLFKSHKFYISGFFLLFNLAFWQSALIAEIYPLHHFFLALLLLLFVKWWETEDERLLLLFVFLFGLSLTNNPTYIFLLPLFPIIMFVRRGWFIKISDLKFTFFFFLGLTPYFYLIIRSQADPIIDWGNPESFSQFIWVITGREFAEKVTTLEYAPQKGFLTGFLDYFGNLPKQFSWFILPLFPLGLFQIFRKAKYFFWLTLSIFLINIAYSLAFWGESLALEAYLIPSYMMLAIWAGFGFSLIKIPKLPKSLTLSIWILIISILIFPPAIHRFQKENKSLSKTAYYYGKGICETLEKGENAKSAIFLTENTLDLFLVFYHQLEGRCENTRLIYLPYLKFDWYKAQLNQKFPEIIIPEDGNWLKNNVPVFYTPDQTFNFRVENLHPEGLIYKVVKNSPKDVPIPKFEYDYERFGDGELPSKRRYALLYARLGNYFYQKGNFEKTLHCYEKAKEIFPENPNIYYNLGYFHQKMNELDLAIENYQKSIELDPNFASNYYNLGSIYLNQNRYELAENFLRKTIQKDRKHLDARYNLANLYLRQNRLEPAIEELEKIIEFDPDYANAYKDLGIVYITINNRELGVIYLKKYLKLNPNSQHKKMLEGIIYENENKNP